MSAERLRAAAELILTDQVEQEAPIFQAYEAAVQEALPHACGPEGAAHAEIKCEPPDYRLAQLPYAYAIENVLKGLMIANNARLAGKRRLSREIISHDLVALAEKATFELPGQEKSAMGRRFLDFRLSWPISCGYHPERQGTTSDPDALLDCKSQHPIMRRSFDRAAGKLEKKLTCPRTRFGVVVVFGPKLA